MLMKWKQPINAEEAQERFTLVEDRGDRLLVSDTNPYWDGKLIRPQFACLKSEVVETQD